MTPQPPASPGEGAAHASAQELLMIRLGARPYLIPLHDVREIVRPSALTPVPMAPDHLLGLANIHGQTTCILDPCRVLHLDGCCQAQDTRTRYIVLRHPQMHIGIRVDDVASIFEVATTDLPQQDGMDEAIAILGPVPGVEGELLNARALFR